jgi:hypothetical protein
MKEYIIKNVIMKDYLKIFVFYSKFICFNPKQMLYNKKFQLKQNRPEQSRLRQYLINNKKHKCVICDKILPLCLLETAHLKPRCILNHKERNDKNVVEFMCRYCHHLYDNGLLSVNDGLLYVSPIINKYDLQYDKNKPIKYYNLYNEKYFNFHYNYIFMKR